MEGDRGVSLLVRAAAKNVIDFKSLNLCGRHDWLRVNWLLNEIEVNESIEMLRLQQLQHLSLIGITNQDNFNKDHWEKSNELLKSIFNSYFPYLANVQDKSLSNEREQMLEQWKQIYGDINDPEVRARCNKIAQAIRRKREKAQKENLKAFNSPQEQLRKVNRKRRGKRLKLK